jgi:hypothetical protein
MKLIGDGFYPSFRLSRPCYPIENTEKICVFGRFYAFTVEQKWNKTLETRRKAPFYGRPT